MNIPNLASTSKTLLHTALLLTGTLATCGNLALAAPGPILDQKGEPLGLDTYKGKPVMVYVAKTTKLSQSKDWEEALYKSYPDLKSIIVADIAGKDGKSETEIAKILDFVLPKKIDVAIDMKNEWANEYKLDLSEICLLLFDANKNLVAQFSGKENGTLLAEVEAAVAKVLPATTGKAETD